MKSLPITILDLASFPSANKPPPQWARDWAHQQIAEKQRLGVEQAKHAQEVVCYSSINMKNIILFIILSLILAVPGFSRTWTSTDGRTIEASIVSKGSDFVVLRLDSTGATVTVKHELLSAADVAYLKSEESNTSVQQEDKDGIVALISKYPHYKYTDENGRQLNEKYLGFVKIMTPATAFKMCQLMRQKLPEDVKYWKEQASRPEPKRKYSNLDDPRYVKEKANIEAIVADRNAKVVWLTKTLPAWLSEVEKASSR